MSIHPCPYCNHPNHAHARFCRGCGRELPAGQTCATCGFDQSPPEAEFCIQCGAPLRARRTMPILAWVGGGFLVSALAAGILLWQLGVIAFPSPAILPSWADRSEPTTEVVVRGTPEATKEASTETATPIVATATPTPVVDPTARTLSPAPDSSSAATQRPSATPALTATPLPTSTPASTSTPGPTLIPSPTPCSFDVYSGFARIWQDDQERLGCPTAPASTSLWIAEESFQRGRMLWREDNDKIYVLLGNGQWERYNDIWNEGDPEYSCGTPKSPPTPKRGFGKIWCTYQNVRDGLGNAVTTEWGTTGAAQTFSGGFIVQTDGGTHVLYNDGSWR